MTKDEFLKLADKSAREFMDDFYARTGGMGYSRDMYYGILARHIVGKFWPFIESLQDALDVALGIPEDEPDEPELEEPEPKPKPKVKHGRK